MDSKFLYLPKSLPVDDDNVTNYNKQQFENDNMLMNETDNLVTSSGQTVSPSDDEQLSKGVLNYSLCSDFFTDASTVADVIVLTDNGTFAKPIEYTDGMKVSFLANYSNTGSATINVNGLGAKSIYLDANSSPLTGTEIKEKEIVNLRYNSVLGGFIIVLGGGGGGGSSRNIGEIVTSDLPLADAGLKLLNGELILAGGSNDAFYLYMKTIYDSGLYPDLFTSEANWQSDNTNFGGCEKYVFTDGVSVRLPKAYNKNRFVIKESTVGDNWYRIYNDGWIEQGGYILSSSTGNGTLIILPIPYTNTNYNVIQNADSGTILAISYYNSLVQLKTVNNFYIKSSGSNQVSWEAKGYGVIPNGFDKPDYKYVVVATAIKTDIVVDIDNIMTDLNGKADVDLSNVDRETIVGWGMPDYTAGIAITTPYNNPYTAQANGWVFGYISVGPGFTNKIFVNSKEVTIQVGVSFGSLFPVSKGDIITTDAVVGDFVFYPCIGA